jgi:endoglucanase
MREKKTMALREDLLRTLLSQPTAPFREKHVIQALRHTLSRGHVPFFEDRIGNVVVGVGSEKEYLQLLRSQSHAKEPVRVFIAHMDHPGFHGSRWINTKEGHDELEVKWHGGSPTAFLKDAKTWLATSQGPWGEGRITQAQLLENGRAIQTARVRILKAVIPSHGARPRAEEIYGGFSFRSPLWKEGDLYYTKAADDLVGVFAIVSLALDLFSKKGKNKHAPMIGLLTRAEEVGFIGAIGHFEAGYLQKAKRPILCVSLETSRTLPGAELGKGPVVRLGDKYTVFDAGALRVFTELALKSLPEKHQRRVMDGGSCEATAATVYGFPCIGISVPLGNYHNQNLEGGPDSTGPNGPAPEFVHQDDIEGLLTLCHALLQPKLAWASPWASRLKDFKKEFKRYQPLLQSGP